jgi:hypothetical protein
MVDTIKEAQNAKDELENAILDKIRAFESRYGISVQSVDLIHHYCIGSNETVASVSVIAEI